MTWDKVISYLEPNVPRMLGHLRPYVASLRRLLAWPYLRFGMTPTQVGLFGIIMACLAAFLFRMGFLQVAFWVAMLALATDMADGEVARATNSETPQGNYLDAVGDRLRECILLAGLLNLAPDLVTLAILGTCLTSFAKARCALVVVMDNSDWSGVGDHADRAVIILFCYLLAPANLWPIVVLALVTWSCFFIRVRTALRKIDDAGQESLLPYLRDSEE
jgi:phosphatidylglycerophosphate synthase